MTNIHNKQRLSRLIRYSFWDGLTRRIDASSIETAGKDPKDCEFPLAHDGVPAFVYHTR